jgi:hypothetical protein
MANFETTALAKRKSPPFLAGFLIQRPFATRTLGGAGGTSLGLEAL